jgi:glycosyltransferase involved in cell wall biosynthesis
VIPEILTPIKGQSYSRIPQDSPRFVWVGQDIPRKNLPAALDLFERLRSTAFPNATLDVFGVTLEGKSNAPQGVNFRGWVSAIDWDSYRHDGVLMLTSYREGLPSAVLEAASAGLLCLVSDVGSLRSLELPTMQVLNHAEYPNYSTSTVTQLVARIREHLTSEHLDIAPVDFRSRLHDFLSERGIR